MRLTKELILNHLTQEEIMSKYFPEVVQINRKYRNPFRQDSRPDCYFTWSNNNNFVFIDLANPEMGGSCFDICMHANNCSYYEALKTINQDFGLGLGIRHYKTKVLVPKEREVKPIVKVKAPERVFRAYSRAFDKRDLKYWSKFHIKLKTLKKFNVFPVKQYMLKSPFMNNYINKYKDDGELESVCYCYKIKSSSPLKLKLYQPYKTDKTKWDTNCNKEQLQGYEQLPKEGEELIITSSLKDAMVLYELGYTVVAPLSETTFMNEELITNLKNRFKSIKILFDNDNAGIKYAKHFSELHNIEYRLYKDIPQDLLDIGTKDVAEFAEYMDFDSLKNFINNILK